MPRFFWWICRSISKTRQHLDDHKREKGHILKRKAPGGAGGGEDNGQAGPRDAGGAVVGGGAEGGGGAGDQA